MNYTKNISIVQDHLTTLVTAQVLCPYNIMKLITIL